MQGYFVVPDPILSAFPEGLTMFSFQPADNIRNQLSGPPSHLFPELLPSIIKPGTNKQLLISNHIILTLINAEGKFCCAVIVTMTTATALVYNINLLYGGFYYQHIYTAIMMVYSDRIWTSPRIYIGFCVLETMRMSSSLTILLVKVEFVLICSRPLWAYAVVSHIISDCVLFKARQDNLFPL